MPSLMKARSGVLNSNIGGNALAPLFSTGALTIANAITDVTRLAGVEGDGAAYPDSSVGVWPAATNLVINGGFETNTTGWNANGATTISRSTEWAKFGGACLKMVAPGSASEEGGINSTSGSRAAISPATMYTASGWFYSPTGGTFRLIVNTYTAVTGGSYVTTHRSSDVVIAAGAIARITVTFTSGAGSNGAAVGFATAGAQALTFYGDGAQVEAGSIATPYIETNGGTASRSAGSITAIPAGVLDETRMWVMARIRVDSTPTGSGRILSFGDSQNERVEFIVANTNQRMYTIRQTGGAGAGLTSGSGTIAVGDTATYIGGVDANFIYAANNGAALSSAANTSIPTLSATEAALGKQGWASFGNPGVSYKWLAIGLAAPTDALSALGYSWGNNDPLPHMFPKSAQLTFLAHFNGDGTFYRRSA